LHTNIIDVIIVSINLFIDLTYFIVYIFYLKLIYGKAL